MNINYFIDYLYLYINILLLLYFLPLSTGIFSFVLQLDKSYNYEML